MNYKSLEELNFIIEDGDRGKNYPSPSELYSDGYCLFLNNKNIINNKLNIQDSNYISEEKHKQLHAGNLSINDIVITTRGTLGNCLIIDKKFPLPARINSGMVIIHKNNLFIQKYLYYFFSSELFHNQILSLQSGAAQPQIPIKDLLKVNIPVICKDAQQHIVNTILFLLLKFLQLFFLVPFPPLLNQIILQNSSLSLHLFVLELINLLHLRLHNVQDLMNNL